MARKRVTATAAGANAEADTSSIKSEGDADSKVGSVACKRVKVSEESSSNSSSNSTARGVVPLSERICDSALEAIGNTPLVRLNNIGKEGGIKCELLAKCEFFNAGGSVKDRIAKRMVEDAEKSGRIKPGDTLIEPTSGNTGIGIALAAAIRGYRCIIVLPEKMSKEKVDVLKALGAEIVRTPTEAAYDAPDSHISVAKRLNSEIPNSHILDQYRNPSNPLAHYEGTAEELIRQCSGDGGGTIDMLVAGAGTGGTITGLAKRMREYNPNIIIVAVDPVGSILAVPDNLNDLHRLESYQVEGIGYDFIPDVLDRTLVNQWIKTNDSDSLVMMRRLIREEGLLCGGSSGAAVHAALQAAKSLRKGQRCVVMLPDSVRNYMTKALSDDWMVDHDFVDHKIIKPIRYQTWWANKRVCDIAMKTPVTVTSEVSCREAIALLKQEGFDMVPVLGEDGNVLGVVTEGHMTSMILNGRVSCPDTSVADANVIFKQFRKVNMSDTLGDLARALDSHSYALVITEQRCFTRGGGGGGGKSEEGKSGTACKVKTRSVVSGIVTRIDLLDFVSGGDQDKTKA